MQSTHTRWYQSVAIKNNVVTFVATHVPLLGLIALIVLWPERLSPWTVFFTALAFTLISTAAVICAQWRLFRPLRAAASGLQNFMARGASFRDAPGTSDEIGRLVSVIVDSLAHLDRGRAPLLNSGAIALGRVKAGAPPPSEPLPVWLVLAEIDEPRMLDGHRGMAALVKLHTAIIRAADALVTPSELALPWGRGRVLLMLRGTSQDVRDRVERMCARVDAEDADAFTASAAIEPEGIDDLARAAALQRLEQKLFSIRERRAEAEVA